MSSLTSSSQRLRPPRLMNSTRAFSWNLLWAAVVREHLLQPRHSNMFEQGLAMTNKVKHDCNRHGRAPWQSSQGRRRTPTTHSVLPVVTSGRARALRPMAKSSGRDSRHSHPTGCSGFGLPNRLADENAKKHANPGGESCPNPISLENWWYQLFIYPLFGDLRGIWGNFYLF